jgi:Ca2+:H+ antiporter
MREGHLAAGAAALLTVATAVTVLAGAPDVTRFIVAALALAALAAVVGQSIEQVGERLGPGPTGLLQSSLGNLPELLVGIFALRAGLVHVVQAALVGSVLANLLLVLGVAFLSGGMRHGMQRFDPEAPRMLVTLLALAVGAMLVPTLAVRLHTPATHHADALSDVVAIVLLLVYAASIPFWLSGGPGAVATGTLNSQGSPPPGGAPGPGAGAPQVGRPWSRELASPVVLLVAAALASALVSDWFVAALTPATRTLGISQVFTGLVIVAIASNAVENVAGIRFAWKARADYAISTILNSPLQIALFLTPLLVLLSPLVGRVQLTMVLPSLLVGALAIAVGVVTVVVYDGEYSWLEGVALVALYAVTASALWWG